jgi:hypothetical protein
MRSYRRRRAIAILTVECSEVQFALAEEGHVNKLLTVATSFCSKIAVGNGRKRAKISSRFPH